MMNIDNKNLNGCSIYDYWILCLIPYFISYKHLQKVIKHMIIKKDCPSNIRQSFLLKYGSSNSQQIPKYK